MGRPTKPTTQIVVQVDNDYLVWTDGHLSGSNKTLINYAKYLSKYELDIEVTPYGPVISAKLEEISAPERAMAAMMGAGAGRGILLEAPQVLLDLLPLEDEE